MTLPTGFRTVSVQAMGRSSRRYAFLWFPLLILLTPLLLAASYMVRCGYDWENAWQSTIHFGKSGTRYGQGFEERAFGRVRPGMKGDEVYRLLGQPMEGHLVDGKPGREWIYSLPQLGRSHYHLRVVVFDVVDGQPPIVSRIQRRFHSPVSD